MKILNITHAGCYDGSCSSFLIKSVYPEAEIRPCNYGSQRAEMGRDLVQAASHFDKIFITDFSFGGMDLLRALEVNGEIYVFDHHKTARDELALAVTRYPDRVFFDVYRCGARMVFDYFEEKLKDKFDIKYLKRLINYVQDRDLWRWKMKNSKLINGWIRTYDHESWDKIFERWVHQPPTLEELNTVHRLNRKIIDAAKSHAKDFVFEGLKTKIVNQTTDYMSEILGELAQETESGIAIGWFYNDGEFVYSLRGRGCVDVSELAVKYGGGGHPNAAGFELKEMLCVS